MTYLHVERDDLGIAWVHLHTPDSKVNTLGADLMFALDEALAELTDATAVIFVSDKECQFIAGADINELEKIDTENEALAKSRMGQEIFSKIAALKVPTLAVINGPSMGGGTELALACDWRLMTDAEHVSIALPEVRLGIVPGWGGTQRLPRLVGFAHAVDMIVSGRSIRGRRCLSFGLVDKIINAAFWREEAQSFIQKKIKKPKVPKRRWRGFLNWILNKTPFGRKIVTNKAQKGIAQQGKHYPALGAALKLICETWSGDLEEGLQQEAKEFAQCAVSPVSKNLVRLFLTNEAAKRQFSDYQGDQIEYAGVLGAGIMGGGIAWLFSSKGIKVRVKDINWKALTKAFQTAAKIYREQVKKKRIEKSEMNVAMHRLSGGLDSIGMRHAQVVVEAVVEDIEIKRSVLAETEAVVTPDCTLCTNTSSLLVADMHEGLQHPERLVGMHFFNPVQKMPLIEVVRGAQSAEEHIQKVTRLAVRLGKTPVVVNDCAGFLVNRILMPYMNEAVYCAQDGADFERVDRILKNFGMPMGPFLLADEIGLDVCAKVAHQLSSAYGDRMKVAELLDVLNKEHKLLGKKGGKGFYTHGKKRHISKLAQKEQRKYLNQSEAALSDEDILDRCILVMINEAARCLDEGIVEDPAALDLAMIMGTGFPPFRGGLLRYADSLDSKHCIKRMHGLHSSLGTRFEVSPALLAYLEAGGFYREQVS